MLTHKGTQPLETERLLLRKFNKNDAVYMYKNWATDSEVCKFLSWDPHRDLRETKQLVESWINAYSPNCYYWAIELKDIGEIIGSISIMGISEKYNSCMVGYNIGRLF